MPPNTPRKPLIELPKDTELSKEQLRGICFNYKLKAININFKLLFLVLKDAFKIFDSDNKGAIALDVVKIILELLTGKK